MSAMQTIRCQKVTTSYLSDILYLLGVSIQFGLSVSHILLHVNVLAKFSY